LDRTDLAPGSTAYDRFQEWEQTGVFLKFWQAGVEQFDELKGLDWAWLSMDGVMTKAPWAVVRKREGIPPTGEKRGEAQPFDRMTRRSHWIGSEGANRNA